MEETLRELRETQQQLVLQEKMASLGNLVAGIAHEINNPIGVINSASDVVKRCIEKIETALAQRQEGNAIEKPILMLKDNNRLILSAGTRIAALVKSLKNFARLDEEEYQEADLREGIESTLTLIEQQVSGRIDIEKRLSELPRVYCSPGRSTRCS